MGTELTVYQGGLGAVTADGLNTFEQTCDTIAQLRSFTGVPGLQAFCRGKTTVGDGFAGPFQWNESSTASDNGQTVIAPTGSIMGRWISLGYLVPEPGQVVLVPGQLPGTNTNDNAEAGNVGQFISAFVLPTAPVSLTSNIAINVTSITIPPGDWDVWGNIGFSGNPSTLVQSTIGSISSGSTVLATDRSAVAYGSTGLDLFAATTIGLAVASQRFLVATPTPAYLVGVSSFSVSTCAAFGSIYARRRR